MGTSIFSTFLRPGKTLDCNGLFITDKIAFHAPDAVFIFNAAAVKFQGVVHRADLNAFSATVAFLPYYFRIRAEVARAEQEPVKMSGE